MSKLTPKLILASGPVIVENDKVLLNQHGDTEFWKFCGGSTTDFYTRLTDIAHKRAKEEMGIDIELTTDNPYFQHVIKDLEGGPADVILVHFLAKRTNKIKPGKETRQWAWILLKDLKKYNLAPNIIPALKHFGFIK